MAAPADRPSIPGSDLLSLRRAAGFSARQVAERCGFSRSRLEHVEGSAVVTTATAERIEAAIRSLVAEAEAES